MTCVATSRTLGNAAFIVRRTFVELATTDVGGDELMEARKRAFTDGDADYASSSGGSDGESTVLASEISSLLGAEHDGVSSCSEKSWRGMDIDLHDSGSDFGPHEEIDVLEISDCESDGECLLHSQVSCTPVVQAPWSTSASLRANPKRQSSVLSMPPGNFSVSPSTVAVRHRSIAIDGLQTSGLCDRAAAVLTADLCAQSNATSRPAVSRSDDAAVAFGRNAQGFATNSAGHHTSLLLKNVPISFKRGDVCKLLDSMGLAGRYNFVYVPQSLASRTGFGYAFANFVQHMDASLAKERLDGFDRWADLSGGVCTVEWSNTQLDLSDLIAKYRNCPIMHREVPEDAKPLLLRNGAPVPFPAPTKALRPPRGKGKEAVV